MGLSTLIVGKYYAATGMAIGYFVINLFLTPLVMVFWCHFKRIWHAGTSNNIDLKKDISPAILNLETSA